MDFHSLVRKDLQSLCKSNKLPANKSNIAMADALASLKIVKGIENFSGLSETTVTKSLVESPEKSVVKSPKVTRTRRKQATERSESVMRSSPSTQLRDGVSVKSVQRVYKTRRSARLLAVKIHPNTDGIPEDDLAEVSENKIVSVKRLQMNTKKATVETPIHEQRAVIEMPMSENKECSDDVVDDMSTETENRSNSLNCVSVKNLDVDKDGYPTAAVAIDMQARVLTRKDTGNLKEHLKLKSYEESIGDKVLNENIFVSTNLDFVQKSSMLQNHILPDNLMIKTKSENVLKPKYADPILDKEYSVISAKDQLGINCNEETGGAYVKVKGIPSQEEVGSKAIVTDGPEDNSNQKNPGYETAVDSTSLQHKICSKQLNNEAGHKLSRNLNCYDSEENADQSDMSGSIGPLIETSGGIIPDEKEFGFQVKGGGRAIIVDPEISPEKYEGTDENPSDCRYCDDTETNNSANNVSDEVTCDDEPGDVKALAVQIGPPAAPRSHWAIRIKITDSEEPLILADYPYTENVIPSLVGSVEPCDSANTTNANH